MTTDDILRMAREAGMDRKPADHNCRVDYFDVVTDSELERFFRLAYAAGAAAERDECAKVCEIDHPHTFARHVAKQIRARGKT